MKDLVCILIGFFTVIVLLLIVIFSGGCATGTLQLNPDTIQGLQTKGTIPTNGCVATNLNGSSGVIGGTNRVVVTWGTLTDSAINWCVGK